MSWRAEGIARDRDDREREEYRARRLLTPDERRAEMAEQIADGSLVIRTATEAERLKFGIKPAAEERYEQVEGDELAAITNLQGPNLTASQRAALIVQREVPAESTAAELAEEVGVSLRTVERALRVREGDAELFQRMVSGEISATMADDQISARMEGKGGC